MVERKEEPMHNQVKLALTIITRLGDYTAMTEEDDLCQNIKDLANIFHEVGDLSEHGNEISDIFVKCFSQLSIQGPILAALLALIHTKDADFSVLVVEKLQAKLAAAVAADNVPVARLLLRAVGCLGAAGVWAVEGEGGVAEVLEELLAVATAGSDPEELAARAAAAEQRWDDAAGARDGGGLPLELSAAAQAAVYLLASMMPWAAQSAELRDYLNGALLEQCRVLLAAVRRHWRSPFAQGGLQALWHSFTPPDAEEGQGEGEAEGAALTNPDTVLSVGPVCVGDVSSAVRGGGAYDSLWEACHIALLALDTLQGRRSSGESEGRGATRQLPGCFVSPWVALTEEGLLPFAPAQLGGAGSDAAEAVDGDGDAGGDRAMAVAASNTAEPAERPAPLRFSTDTDAVRTLLRKRYSPGSGGDDDDDDADAYDDAVLSGDAGGKVLALGSSAACCMAATGSSSNSNTGVATTATTAVGSAASTRWLRLRFSIIDADASPEAAQCCAQLSVLEKAAALALLQDVLLFFEPVANEDGTMLGSLDLLVSHTLAVFKLFPEASRANMQFLLVELLVQTLLQQPTNATLGAQMFRLLLELCRKSPQQFPPAVALAVNIVFQTASEMDTLSLREFGRWFGFHLVNTQLAWPYWDFWLSELRSSGSDGQEGGGEDAGVEVGEAGMFSAVALLVRHVCEELGAAVVQDKLHSALPSALHPLIQADTSARCLLLSSSRSSHLPAPSSGDMAVDDAAAVVAGVHDGDVDVEAAGSVAGSMLGHIPGVAAAADRLRVLLGEERAASDDVEDWLLALDPARIATGAGTGDGMDGEEAADGADITMDTPTEGASYTTAEGMPLCWRGCLLLQVLLQVGGSTAPLSGTAGLLDKYAGALAAVASSEADHKDLLCMLWEVYGHSPRMFGFCLDELLRRQQVGVAAVSSWLFSSASSGPMSSAAAELPLMQSLRSFPRVCGSAVVALELVVDRAADFVRAAAAQRAQLGAGPDLVLDGTLDLSPTPEPEGAKRVGGAGSGGGGSEAAAGAPSAKRVRRDNDECNDNDDDDGGGDDDDDDDDDQGRRKRSRRGGGDDDDDEVFTAKNAAEMAAAAEAAAAAAEAAGDGARVGADGAMVGATGDTVPVIGASAGGAGADEEDEEDEDDDAVDPLWAAGEALKRAVGGSRAAYVTCVTGLVQLLEAETETAARGGEEGSAVAQLAGSLLRRVLRSFHGAERSLSMEHQRSALTTAPPLQARSLLRRAARALNSISGSSSGTKIDPSSWAAQLFLASD